MTDAADLGLVGAAAALANGELSSRELTQAVLDRLDATEPAVHAYAFVLRDQALVAAGNADAARKAGSTGQLLGIPLAVKDLFYTKDAPTEAGSAVLAGFQPDTDATAVRLLRETGAVLIGKTVTHEFAYGMNLPPTRNAWNLDRYPGGSSAGSAVSVAIGSALGALGTDTAGSVRTPAAVNGIVGVKPTYGRVSRYGVIPSSPSLDHVGVLTRTVEDAAILLQAVAGFDPLDRATSRKPVLDMRSALDAGVRGLRLGVERSFFFYDGVAAGVRRAADAALVELERLGAAIVEVSIPELELAVAAGSTIMIVDVSAWHRRLLRTRGQLYHQGTRVMLELGELLPASAYASAQVARQIIRNAVRRAFDENHLDGLVGPAIPITAPDVAQLSGEGKGVDLSGLVHHNYPANLTGQPALVVSCGLADDGMPVGLQVVARPFDEPMLFRIGWAYEQATNWTSQRPDLLKVPAS